VTPREEAEAEAHSRRVDEIAGALSAVLVGIPEQEAWSALGTVAGMMLNKLPPKVRPGILSLHLGAVVSYSAILPDPHERREARQ
jgi:hypothetical protein